METGSLLKDKLKLKVLLVGRLTGKLYLTDIFNDEPFP